MLEDTANPSGAVEVTDVDSAADQIASKLSDPKSTATDETKAKTDFSDEIPKDKSSEQEAETDEQETSYNSIDEIASALGIETEEFLSRIKGKVKIDGQESELTLAELRDGYQREADYRRKTMELAEHRRRFEQETESNRNEITNRLTQVGALVQTIESQLMNDYQSINWQELRFTDPGEYAAKAQEFQARANQIQALKANAIAEVKRLNDEALKKQEADFEAYRQKQNELLLSKVADWKDSNKRTAEEREISNFLREKYGFTKDEARMFTDHRFVMLARDAFQGKAIDQKKEIAKKKVENLPKLLKPGAKQTTSEAKKEAQRKEWSKIKNSNSSDALGAYLASKL